MDIVSGNLFDAEVQTFVNTVNCVGVMGKGIALEYKTRYPAMFERYRELCSQNLIQIGSLWIYKYPEKWILNFPTKNHWRDKSREFYLESGLAKFVETYKDKGVTSIAFPLLGASNGGLDPQVSLDIMVKHLEKCDIPVLIFTSR